MVEYKNLPPALLRDGLFCVWKYENREGKPTKVPYNPRTGGRAQSTNPATFAPLDTALAVLGQYDGLGVGIFGHVGAFDIDHCIDDCIDDNGELSPLAFDVMDTIKGYTEYSPSGHGLRILFKAAGFQYDKARYYINNQKLGLEIYIAGCTNKFVTVTGNALTPGLEIEEHGEQLAAVLEKYMVRTKMKKTTPPSASSGPVELDDVALIEKAKKGRNGEQFAALWAGDTSSYQSQSEADMALCNWLAWWTNKDAARMDRLFRSSGLMREKWDRRQSGSTYGAITIQEAIASCSGGYDPQAHSRRKAEKITTDTTNGPVTAPGQKFPLWVERYRQWKPVRGLVQEQGPVCAGAQAVVYLQRKGVGAGQWQSEGYGAMQGPCGRPGGLCAVHPGRKAEGRLSSPCGDVAAAHQPGDHLERCGQCSPGKHDRV